jgi:hypothetical protein
MSTSSDHRKVVRLQHTRGQAIDRSCGAGCVIILTCSLANEMDDFARLSCQGETHGTIMSDRIPMQPVFNVSSFPTILQLIAAVDTTRTLSSLHHALYPDNEKSKNLESSTWWGGLSGWVCREWRVEVTESVDPDSITKSHFRSCISLSPLSTARDDELWKLVLFWQVNSRALMPFSVRVLHACASWKLSLLLDHASICTVVTLLVLCARTTHSLMTRYICL